MKRIGIIGAGISGLGAAYALKGRAHVTVFEKDARAGGHASTHVFDYDGAEMAVDLGFIVYNGQNYPNLTGLFEALCVETQASDMSFAVCDPNGWQWASTARGLFAQKRNLFSPKFHRFWRTILRFNDLARAELAKGAITQTTLRAWLDWHGFDQTFRDNYICPMGAAIWSTPENEILDYPALSFFQFFDNHRLMHKERPKWRTVTGGSRNYVSRALEALGPAVRLSAGVARVSPFGAHVKVDTLNDETHLFDEVIFATHSDTAHDLVEDNYSEAAFLLKSVRYRPNRIYLHRDARLMPSRRAAWASWNVIKQTSGDICLTYDMNRLQGLDASRPLFITLNPETPPEPAKTFLEYSFDHPQFDLAADAAVRGLKRIQGQNGLWFAGAWMGRGFHEDGLKSGLSAALSLGGHVPWDAKGVEIVQPGRQTAEALSAQEVFR